MKQHSKQDTVRTAAATWTWYTFKGYACDLDFLPPLNKFVLMIGHTVESVIPSCPLLQEYRYNISDEIVAPDWKIYMIDLFL